MTKLGKKSSRQSYDRAITPVEYTGLQKAYDHFNAELFGKTLPDVFITYQRKAHSRGYFSADRFAGRVGKFGKHELALNPDAFRPCKMILPSTMSAARQARSAADMRRRSWAKP